MLQATPITDFTNNYPINNIMNTTTKALKKNNILLDPELEAEVRFAKENGLSVPTKLASDIAREKEELDQAIIAWVESETKTGKNTKAARKARSRGVSGCSGRKDGNRFDYGLDCIDFAYESNPVKDDADESSDEDDEDYFQFDTVVVSNEPKIRSAIDDYFANGNVEEAVDSIDNYALTKEVIAKATKQLIELTLNHGVSKVKATSLLLGKLLEAERATVDTIVDSFEDIFGDFKNIIVDFPNAPKIFEHLLARLVYDEVVEIQDLQKLRVRVTGFDKLIEQIFKVTMGYVRNPAVLRSLFEPTNEEPLYVIDSHFVNILREYATSLDKDNAACRVRNLKVPHYSHTFVFQTLVFAVDKNRDNHMLNMVDLLSYMVQNGFLTLTAVTSGFQMFFNSFDDLAFDVPLVFASGKILTNLAFEAGIVDRTTQDKVPSEPVPVQVSKRISAYTDDTDMGIGSMSSTASSDEEAAVKKEFKKYHGENGISPVDYNHTVY
uniref:Programmed cell death protein 4 n=1 Tax=Panagrellus redivivus TaxID=6233 RepID=A0A7E4WAA8_PANRE